MCHFLLHVSCLSAFFFSLLQPTFLSITSRDFISVIITRSCQSLRLFNAFVLLISRSMEQWMGKVNKARRNNHRKTLMCDGMTFAAGPDVKVYETALKLSNYFRLKSSTPSPWQMTFLGTIDVPTCKSHWKVYQQSSGSSKVLKFSSFRACWALSMLITRSPTLNETFQCFCWVSQRIFEISAAHQ